MFEEGGKFSSVILRSRFDHLNRFLRNLFRLQLEEPKISLRIY